MTQEEKSDLISYTKLLKAGAVALALLSLFLFAKFISEVKGWKNIGNEVPPQTVISVSGKGEIIVKPDIANFSFGIQEESLTVDDAQTKVAQSENEILTFLKKSGVSEDDIKVSGYNLYPRYDYLKSGTYGIGKQVLAAYVVSEYVDVKVRKIGDAGKLIGSLGELGATNLSGLTFSVDKQEEVLKQAREKAIADARVNAKKLAGELGVSLVRVVNFSENGGGYPSPVYYAKAEMSASSADRSNPNLPSGTNKIISNVSVTYEIR